MSHSLIVKKIIGLSGKISIQPYDLGAAIGPLSQEIKMSGQ